jgi:hypothetical protein
MLALSKAEKNLAGTSALIPVALEIAKKSGGV